MFIGIVCRKLKFGSDDFTVDSILGVHGGQQDSHLLCFLTTSYVFGKLRGELQCWESSFDFMGAWSGPQNPIDGNTTFRKCQGF